MTAIATLAMAENHINTNSIGLQLQAECWYEQKELPQPGSSPIFLQSEHNGITLHSDYKNRGSGKTRKTTDRVPWTSWCLCKGGGGGGITELSDGCAHALLHMQKQTNRGNRGALPVHEGKCVTYGGLSLE